MKRVPKGSAGYFAGEKRRRFLQTLILFAIPLAIYASGWAYHGTRNNVLTVVAVLGVIPAARFAISWFMVLMQKPAPKEIVRITEETAGDLVHGYELTITAYEGQMPLDAVVVCGKDAMCISTRGDEKQFSFMEKHMAKMLSASNLYGVNVKIFSKTGPYRDRIAALAANPQERREKAHFTPENTEDPAEGDRKILQVIKDISI